MKYYYFLFLYFTLLNFNLLFSFYNNKIIILSIIFLKVCQIKSKGAKVNTFGKDEGSKWWRT